MKEIEISRSSKIKRAEVLNEIKLLRTLTKKEASHVVEYYSAFEEGKHFFIIMEYCAQGDLAALLHAQKLKKE